VDDSTVICQEGTVRKPNFFHCLLSRPKPSGVMVHGVILSPLFYIDRAPRLRYIPLCFLDPITLWIFVLHHGDCKMIVLETILGMTVPSTG
jgi:hypothetical protein